MIMSEREWQQDQEAQRWDAEQRAEERWDALLRDMADLIDEGYDLPDMHGLLSHKYAKWEIDAGCVYNAW